MNIHLSSYIKGTEDRLFRTMATLLPVLVLYACSTPAAVPDVYTETDQNAVIYPDYTDIVIPPNIAPMNFTVAGQTGRTIVNVSGKGSESFVSEADRNGTFHFDSDKWHMLLENSKGSEITFQIYTFDGSSWTRYPSFSNRVAEENIDRYISYRLIEPGYTPFHNLGLFQRDLESFTQTTIYRNPDDDHCINCHTYQNRKTDHMLFHVRKGHGGTVLVDGDRVEKIDTKVDQLYAACVYPSWHPTQRKIAFSVNTTGQIFRLFDTDKVEVEDEESDLVLYDIDKREITPILTDSTDMETFPSWAPSGDRLYYSVCSSLRGNDKYHTESKVSVINANCDSLYYDLWSIQYDTVTGKFSNAQPEFEASALKKSATLPRISPDGKWLLFTLGNSGQFHIWHKSSDLYIKDMTNGETHPLRNANSDYVDSFHTWSSNGRWIVFSSRRDDGNFTRPYFCYFDSEGHDYKAFILPQEDPAYNTLLFKSYNLPEFMTEPVSVTEEKFRDVIYNTDPVPSHFNSNQ